MYLVIANVFSAVLSLLKFLILLLHSLLFESRLQTQKE